MLWNCRIVQHLILNPCRLLETERTKERKKQTKEERNKETTALLLHISVITLSNKIKLFSNINELSVREERGRKEQAEETIRLIVQVY